MTDKPNLTVSSLDLKRLENLLDSPAGRSFPGRSDLQQELDRATIMEPEEMPPTVVTMNSTVRFKVESSPEEFTLTLVYPRDVGANAGRISIMAPVGSAMLGLSQGDSIEWPKPGGGQLRVRIEEITYQPERAGELHR